MLCARREWKGRTCVPEMLMAAGRPGSGFAIRVQRRCGAGGGGEAQGLAGSLPGGDMEVIIEVIAKGGDPGAMHRGKWDVVVVGGRVLQPIH